MCIQIDLVSMSRAKAITLPQEYVSIEGWLFIKGVPNINRQFKTLLSMTDNGRQRGVEGNVNGCTARKTGVKLVYGKTILSTCKTTWVTTMISLLRMSFRSFQMASSPSMVSCIPDAIRSVGCVYSSIIYPTHASLISHPFTTVDPFLFRNTETQWLTGNSWERDTF